MHTKLVPSLLSLALLASCASKPSSPSADGETGTSGDEEMNSDDNASSTETNSDTGTEPANKKVDILFVIDNSHSMAEEQANLIRGAANLIDTLEAVEADFHIAVTTTDNGNPWCGTTGPEAGHFVYESCLDRIGDFTSPNGSIVADEIACQNHCQLTNAQLGITGESLPWLEAHAGESNLPSGVSVTEAFQCLIPQGINGCGFESQLESMLKALDRVTDEGSDHFGFIREDAVLAVVLVTDELDCSSNSEWSTIFETSGNQVFWPPEATGPNSGICWNAGTACAPSSTGGYDCVPADYDVDGKLLNPDAPLTQDNAVLFPVSRYVNALQTIQDEKAALHPERQVIVATINGVASDGVAYYADSPDPEFTSVYGIGPGCSTTMPGHHPCSTDADCTEIDPVSCDAESGYCLIEQQAVPPVRMVPVAEHFGDNQFSACEADFAPALEAIGAAIIEQF